MTSSTTSRLAKSAFAPALLIVAASGASSQAGPAHRDQYVVAATTVTCASLAQDIADLKADLQFSTGVERIIDMRALNADYLKKTQLHCP